MHVHMYIYHIQTYNLDAKYMHDLLPNWVVFFPLFFFPLLLFLFASTYPRVHG